MFKLLLPLVAMMALGEACNYEKLDKIDKLMDRFLNLVAEQKYKYQAALMTHELLNSVELESQDYEANAEPVMGFLGSTARDNFTGGRLKKRWLKKRGRRAASMQVRGRRAAKECLTVLGQSNALSCEDMNHFLSQITLGERYERYSTVMTTILQSAVCCEN